MRSEKQIQASRINGARSRGPVTAAGKRNSTRNRSRHRLLAGTVVLEQESTQRFVQLLQGFIEDYQPRNSTQLALVETMAVARWRQLRVWGAQKTGLDRDIALQDPAVESVPVRTLVAIGGTPESACRPDILVRYDIAFDRQFNRALHNLRALQALPAGREALPAGREIFSCDSNPATR